LLPTTLGSADLRTQIEAEIRALSVFSARVHNARVLDAIAKWSAKLAAGATDLATARLEILKVLREVGYTPEGGFPDAPDGAVPPAEPGTLQDITSQRRLDLILKTLRALARGRAQQIRGMQPDRLRAFPAYELYRAADRDEKRKWGGKHDGTPPRHRGDIDPRPRWTIAGGTLYEGRLLAFKGDPVWGELGSSANFDDALDVDFSPFAYGSGMDLIEVPADECERLGMRGPDGETAEEWLAQDHPLLLDTQGRILPPPQASVKDLGPVGREILKKQGIVITDDGTATTPEAAAKIREQIAARREARAARREARDARARAKMGLDPEGGAP
jgi:hypothetical protein